MWKINSSYLLVPEDISGRRADNSPLLIKLVEKPFEKIFDYYYDSVSESQVLKKGIMGAVKKNSFEKLFEKISDYKTEGSIFHLYKLRSNVTRINFGLVTDGAIYKGLPKLSKPTIAIDKVSQIAAESKPFGDNNIVPTQEHFYGDHYMSAINQVPNDFFNNDFVTSESAKAINTGGRVIMNTIFWSASHMMGK